MNEQQLFLSLAEASPIGIYLLQERAFKYTNPMFSTITGFARDELFGRNCLSLVHPYDREFVRASARLMLKGQSSTPYEYRVVNKDGSVHWILETVAPTYFEGPVVVGNFMEITDRKQAELEMEDRARRDSATRLLNHGAFLEELVGAIATHGNLTHSLVFADVEGLKLINDHFGHQLGDLVLRAVAGAMDQPGVTAGRYGGDEFVALLTGFDPDAVAGYCAEVERTLAATPIVDARTRTRLHPSLTMGVASYPADASSVSGLIKAADDAMFQSRQRSGPHRPFEELAS